MRSSRLCKEPAPVGPRRSPSDSRVNLVELINRRTKPNQATTFRIARAWAGARSHLGALLLPVTRETGSLITPPSSRGHDFYRRSDEPEIIAGEIARRDVLHGHARRSDLDKSDGCCDPVCALTATDRRCRQTLARLRPQGNAPSRAGTRRLGEVSISRTCRAHRCASRQQRGQARRCQDR